PHEDIGVDCGLHVEVARRDLSAPGRLRLTRHVDEARREGIAASELLLAQSLNLDCLLLVCRLSLCQRGSGVIELRIIGLARSFPGNVVALVESVATEACERNLARLYRGRRWRSDGSRGHRARTRLGDARC